MAKNPKRPRDPNLAAKFIVDLAVGEVTEACESESDSKAATSGRLGGLKGGPARAQALSAQEKREIAKEASLARWRKNGKK